MALYAIGDLHLSLTADKSMEVFGDVWKDYVDRIAASFDALTEADTLILAGDTSWGMSLEEAEADFRFLDQFPGRKLLVKGNHDYWWTTAAKFHRFCEEKRLYSLELLHNNCAFYDDFALCGTRGWFLEEDAHNRRVLNREIQRLETSLKAAGKTAIFCFLHYPPLYHGYQCPEILAVLEKYHVKRCYYGHLHGPVIRRKMEGERNGTSFFLISADYLGFVPKKIWD